MPTKCLSFLASLILLLTSTGLAAEIESTAKDPIVQKASDAEVDFAREIQPLLARRCFACHGPDDAEAGLRLDSRDAALAELDSGEHAIVAHQPEKSVILQRVASSDEDFRMPPEGKPLTDHEQSLIRRWIELGANWKQHWSFEPIAQPQVPTPVANSSSDNPIDAFIDAKLQSQSLTRNPTAKPIELLRRLYFDLTGLPPTPQQTSDFLNRSKQDAAKAYETEVDALLASPRFGERWGRHWLDVVRYAETNSFERDSAKPNAWRYRDYVIRSFNNDLPYDQFVRQQIAGDELPEVTRESLVATGFYRLGVWDDEPADPALARFDEYDDILMTVGQGFLGLTLNCCRCHDHKIDPIPATDYYSTLAFFRNITPNGNGPNSVRPLIASEQERERHRLLEIEIRETGDRLQGELTKVEQQIRTQLEQQSSAAAAINDLDAVEFRFYRNTFEKLPDFDSLKAEEEGKLTPPVFDISGASRPDDFGFVFTGKLIVPADGKYQFDLDSDDGARLIIDGETVILYDGIHGEGNPQSATTDLKQGRRDIRLEYFQWKHGKGLHLKWSGHDFKNRWLTAQGVRKTDDINEWLKSPAGKAIDQKLVADFRKLKKEIHRNSQRQSWDEYGLCVSESGTKSPETFVLLRGNPQSPGEKVEPKFLSILDGQSPTIQPNEQTNTSGRRLAFANWMTDPQNRLTSRVMVNRIWQHHFGRGIVRSPNNFGQLGDFPTHPELLDWLAVDFVNNGWRMKRLHKLILMSQTYQQSSVASTEALAKDPNNDLFSRFNLRRLSAEEVRDSILATNGRLNLTMYGPSVYPEISAEVLAGQSRPGSGWPTSNAQDQVRRSIYVHVKRSLVVPLLSSFDFPETDASCEARFMTTQPGQALGMLNGDFLNQQAVEFANLLRKEAGTDFDAQVQLAYQRAFARSATAAEIQRSRDLFQRLKVSHNMTDDQALNYYCLFLYNLNEFIHID